MRRVLYVAAALLLVPAAMAQPMAPTGEDLVDDAKETLRGIESPAYSPEFQEIKDLVAPEEEPASPDPAPERPGDDPRFADRVATAFRQETMMWGIGSAVAVAVSLSGFFAVTRFISPKEALQNPQRSMLYGYIRGNPGAHLKQLSEEFAMKTSSILWHIRKLESAELVKSERVGGFRVFYAVEGGIEIRRVSRAVTALQNDNARRIFERVHRAPGQTTRTLAEALSMHSGTARWHLRKLRDQGLVDELVQEAGSRFFNTPLGDRALETLEGRPAQAPRARATPNPLPE